MPTLTEQLTQALPEALRDDAAIQAALQAVQTLEQAASRHAAERQFLERAPREGLLFPGDALKLADIGQSDKPLDEVYRNLKQTRPYLFAKPAAAPAQEVLATKPANEAIRQQWRGGLTRQVQISRERFRAP